jgi:3-deoxy-D-manno-octulosonic-acid transferase
MHFIYNIAILFYALALKTAANFNPKAKAWVEGRRNYFQKLPPLPAKKIIWFHCASLGEFDMALPVMNLIKERHPEVFLLVSFFSPSGMQHYHKRKHCVDLAVYLPIDTPSNAKKFISHFKPEKVFFVKYEFWSNFIFEAKKQHVQVFSLCSLFRADHRFFKWFGAFFRKTLKQIDFFYSQNETSTLLLSSIGINNFIISGDTRFDRVIENKQLLHKNERLEEFMQGEKAVIIGSSWPKDEAIILPFIKKNPKQKFIIAPHTIDENHLLEIENQLEGKTHRYTQANNLSKQVLILNTIGHLASAYSYGKIAYVGGGFSGSLHNILEPAVFGLPVIFGPKFKRFPEATNFIQKGIGFSVNTAEEFEKITKQIEHKLEELSEKTIQEVLKNTGASLKIINHLELNFKFESLN